MRTILLLDDDPGMLSALDSCLSREGYKVIRTTNAPDAEAALKNNSIDLAIIDLFLEGEAGDELSNNFIVENLHQGEFEGTPYIRLTSAPKLVPDDCAGFGIVPKHVFRNDPGAVLDFISEIFVTRE